MSFRNKSPKVNKTAYIANTAELIGNIEIGKNSSVWNGAVVRGDIGYIKIGKNSNIQDNSVMHSAANYPTIVGNNVTIGHNAIIHGCKIGNNCLIGMGAIILKDVKIGDWCIIGAGSVITEHSKIPNESIILGVPGKIIKKITEKHKDRIKKNWKEYCDLKKEYMKI